MSSEKNDVKKLLAADAADEKGNHKVSKASIDAYGINIGLGDLSVAGSR